MNNELRTPKYEMRNTPNERGFALPLVIIAVVILVALAVGLMMASFGVRMQAVRTKNETVAMLAAEAGYEQGIFWMSQQSDILGALQDSNSGATGIIDFEGSSCSYEVSFDDYIGARPIFRIVSTGTSGISTRVVDVAVVQAITGWVMGKCRIPSGPTSTTEVYFADSEIIDIPIHINNLKDNPDGRDIYIKGSPDFKQKVEMGESRKTAGGTDKYASVMGFFDEGIYFDQPDVRVTDEAAVQSKINRFRDSTDPAFRFMPAGTARVSNPYNAVQLEFFVDGGVGKVRITNNCTVRGYPGFEKDYKIVPGSGGSTYQKYNIYAYHYAPQDQASLVVPLEGTYVRQKFGTKESEPGGQIFVDGHVVIGSSDYADMVINGKMTIVATGNIWIADSIVVDGPRDAAGMPAAGNPNVLGLIAQGVVKIADPGMSNSTSPAGLPGTTVDDRLTPSKKHNYKPIANAAGSDRALPHMMIVEAAVTVGGGGWGAENVHIGGRRVTGPGSQDFLVLRGTISECVRGVVGIIDKNGYLKNYYLDKRLLEGILPGDIWFGGKYVPAPAGWHDYKPEE
jgi:type II secretory pathway pseudopilin PulG